jgi:DNA-binding NarL/FixJ family response regulator
VSDPPVRVVLVDDHRIVREGTAQLLEQEDGFEVVGQAGSAEEGLPLIERALPDVAIIDINLPGANGLHLVGQIVQRGLPTRSLVLSAHDDYAYVTQALETGIGGYLLKTASTKELADAARAVAHGVFVLDQNVSARLARRWRGTPAEGLGVSSLTKRELDVLRLLVGGRSNKQIASQLSLGLRTVEGYVSSLLAKLGVSSRTEAVAYALDNRLVAPDRHEHRPDAR